MNKNYFLLMLAVVFVFANINAQFTQDAEGLALGPYHTAPWGSWSGAPGAEDIIVSADQAHGGTQSFFVDEGLAAGGPQDAILDLGGQIFGTWGLSFWMYIPADRHGYFNIQGDNSIPIVPQWIVGDIYFGHEDDFDAGIITWSSQDPVDYTLFSFPHDQWFYVAMNFDISLGLTLSTWSMWVDNVEVVPAGTDFQDINGVEPLMLGSLDIFTTDPTCKYYMDDIIYDDEPVPNTTDVAELEAKGFSAYPNPVSDYLHLTAHESISSVEVFNLMGQKVRSIQPNSMATKINMEDLAKGTYFVSVKINDTEGTIKVIR